ncbi:MAG: alcohol dehydrogenase catalytic domain-containing protein, partial [Chloroflexota bacterium]
MMRAAVFVQPGNLELATLPEPVPGPGEVVLQVEAAGLCGSDVHAFEGSFPAPFPFVPGHEVVGTIRELGPGVDPGLLHRRAGVHPLLPCSACDGCAAGRINYCRDLSIYGGNLPGGFAERMTVRVSRLLPVPDGLPAEEAAFAEPLACVLHGLGRIGVERDDRVIIFGAGSIGLLMLQAVRALGAREVHVTDLVPAKLDLAAGLGGVPCPDPSVAAAPFDLVIDATGNPSVVRTLTTFVRDAGRILLFGVCPPEATIEFSPFELFRRELTIAGCFSLVDELEPALALLADGQVRVTPLVSERTGLDGLATALGRHGHGGTRSVTCTSRAPRARTAWSISSPIDPA